MCCNCRIALTATGRVETSSETKIASRMGAITSVCSCVQFVVAEQFLWHSARARTFHCVRAHQRPTENENPGVFAR